MAKWIWVNIGSGHGLLPDGMKPLPKAIFYYHQCGFLALTRDQFHKKYSKYQFVELICKNKTVKYLNISYGPMS